MANQIEAGKVVAYIATGPDSDECAATKVVAYFVLIPGDSGPDTSNKQGHVQAQIIRR